MGAVGGHLAAKLAASGHEVCAVVRGETLAAVCRRGLTLKLGDREIHVSITASDQPADLGRQDLVISSLKANSLSSLAAGVAPLLAEDTAVVFAQNGIPWWYAQGLGHERPQPPDLSRLDPDGALARAVAPQRIIGAVIQSANEMLEPGVVVSDNPTRNNLLVGEPDDRDSDRIGELRMALQAAGMGSPDVRDIRQAIWGKLMLNMSASILCYLTGHPLTVLRDDERICALFMRVAREGMAIAAAHGVDVSDFQPEAVPARAVPHKPSVLQDYERGRPVELENLLLAPQAFGRTAGLETPSLDAIAALAVRQAVDKGLYAL
tara:strand:+ start:474 stop:1436 length:963 start_codon:yes stop_codon:yes gene_type:complete